MSNDQRFNKNLDALNSGLVSKLRLGGRRTGAENLRRAKHRLPRHMRAEADKILRAEEAMAHPKLARIANSGGLDGSFKKLNTHLKKVDLADERRGARINWAAGLVFNVLIVIAGLVILMIWQDLI